MGTMGKPGAQTRCSGGNIKDLSTHLGLSPGHCPKTSRSPTAGVPGSQPTPQGKQVVLRGLEDSRPSAPPGLSTRSPAAGTALPAALIPEEPQSSRVKPAHAASPGASEVVAEHVCRVRVSLVESGPPQASTQGTCHAPLPGRPSLHRSAGQAICAQIPRCSLRILRHHADGQTPPPFPTRWQTSPRLETAGPKPCLPTSLLRDLKRVSKRLCASVLAGKRGLVTAPYLHAFYLRGLMEWKVKSF